MYSDTQVYSLNVDDIQTVSKDLLGRDLTTDEIAKLIDPIAERICWYDAIADAINEYFSNSKCDLK